jgi:phospholipid/cholesterol/gamma-HCH transport system substrate-binding protein
MSDRTKPNDFKIGIFVVIGLALLLAGLCIFGGSRLFERKSIEETYVSGSVGGLKEGSPVLLRGVPVGEVTRIQFSWNLYNRPEPRYVVVEFAVRGDVFLAAPRHGLAERLQEEVDRGLRARIKSQGLVGATIVSLEYLDPKEYPPLSLPWRPQHNYIPAAPGEFKEMLASVQKTLSRVEELDLGGVVQLVKTDLGAVDRLVNHVDEVRFAAIETNANALLSELRNTSRQLQGLIGTNRGPAAANVADVTAQTKELLARLTTTTENLNRIMASLDPNSINQSVENAQRATRELDEVLRKFKTYPSGALFGKPPPPARSVEPAYR